MAPFPEAEIMTIKRLEVAIRRNDFKLLKDGAYKLHEKFHSGHRFEYIDLLKEILLEVQTNPAVPTDVKDILTMTIEDILENNNNPRQIQPLYREEIQEEPVAVVEEQNPSSLTSLGYNQPLQKVEMEPQYEKPVFEEVKREEINQQIPVREIVKEETKINAFEAFSAQVQANQFEIPKKYFTNSPFSAEPFKGFNEPKPAPSAPEYVVEVPKYEPQVTAQESPIQKEIFEAVKHQVPQEPKYIDNPVEETVEEVVEETIVQEPIQEVQIEAAKEVQTAEEEIIEKTVEEIFEQEVKEVQTAPAVEEIVEDVVEEPVEEVFEEVIEEIAKEEKKVAVFYGQDNSSEKIKNIVKLRELLKNEDSSISDVLQLIGEVSTQANANVMELQSLFEQLGARETSTNFITNSQSAMLTHLLKSLEISYSVNNSKEDAKIEIMPLLGLANLFVCENCEETYIAKNDTARPLVLECPQCKYSMYPDFYPAIEKTELNMETYNNAMISLANSKVWLLIHPSFNDKISSNLIETALRISSQVEEIYVLDKDYNVRETYKNIISQLKPNVKVNIQNNIVEAFFNSI